jgi:hypothetical protein
MNFGGRLGNLEWASLAKKRQIVAYPDNSQSLALFGPPAVFEPEFRAVYEELFSRLTAAVVPTDDEEMWLRDIVDLSSEILQLRRFKAGLIVANQRCSLIDTLAPLMKDDKADALAKRFVTRDAAAIAGARHRRIDHGLGHGEVTGGGSR